jgi:chorismate dehydratase
VRTVCIFSHQDLKDCHTIYVDDHSRTSVLLCKLIVSKYYNLRLQYISSDVEMRPLKDGEAKLMIGDKVFAEENDFEYKYDLGALWQTWRGLPFAFAVWIARPDIDRSAITHLNRALSDGLDHVADLSQEDDDLARYFSKNISYTLNEGKRRSIELYLAETAKMD